MTPEPQQPQQPLPQQQQQQQQQVQQQQHDTNHSTNSQGSASHAQAKAGSAKQPAATTSAVATNQANQQSKTPQQVIVQQPAGTQPQHNQPHNILVVTPNGSTHTQSPNNLHGTSKTGVEVTNALGNGTDDLSVSGSLESVTSFGQTRIRHHNKPNLSNLKSEVNIDDHRISIEQVAARYDTHLTQGISKDLAKIRLARNGSNTLTPPKPVSEWYKFSRHLFSGFSILLWIGAALCCAAYAIDRKIDNLILGFVLALVVILTASFSYYQERQSANIMDSFRKLVPNYASVIRDGVRDSIYAENLVVGDLVEVNAGDRVPADLRIVRCNQMRVDNSSLTGESEPQSRSAKVSQDSPLESKCLAFYSTNCVDGTGLGIVIATGDDTVMGRIAGLTARLDNGTTPIAREIEYFVKMITIFAVTLGTIFFILSLLNGYGWLEALVFLIGVIVANVPEGLIATVTVCLTLTAKRMAARKCLVKNLEAVETLGSTSIICSDKTGTLTKNLMTVSHGWYDNHMFKFELQEARKIRLRDARSLAWHCLTRSAKLCSKARFKNVQGSEHLPIRRRLTTGDASESAILKWLEGEFGNVVEYRDKQKKVAEIPFNSTNKYAVTVYDITENRKANNQKAYILTSRHPGFPLSKLSSRSNSHSLSSDSKRRLTTDTGSTHRSTPRGSVSPTNKGSQTSAHNATSIERHSNLNSGHHQSPLANNSSISSKRSALPSSQLSHHSSSPGALVSQTSSRIAHTSSTSNPGRRAKRGGLLSRHTIYTGEEVVHLMQPELDKLDKHCRFLLVMKGAPERVLDRCDTIVVDNEARPLDQRMRENFIRAYEDMGGLGERVMGFADLPLSAEKYNEQFRFNTDNVNFPLTGLRFLGLVSMIDPPRASVPTSVAKCRDAGIRVIMITGDHPITAQSIARSVGIISDRSETVVDIAKRTGAPVDTIDQKLAQAAVIHGAELRDMTSEQLDEVLAIHPEVVFARTSPQQKLQIVEACQRTGAVVAVTGDGVNDSPALKKADIGIAMGVTGSDVSKQASDIILLDDNFSSIVYGVEEGRRIFDNLKKSICYTVTSNIPEIVPFLAYVLIGIPLGLGTVCILLIDLVTDMVPAISLAYEKAETDIMKRKPRNAKTDRLVNFKLLGLAYLQAGVLQASAGFFTYFVLMKDHGWNPSDLYNLRSSWDNPKLVLKDSYGEQWDYASRKELKEACQTAFFVTIVVMQWGNLIACKTRKLSIVDQGMDNQVLNFGLIFETVVTILLIYIPGTEKISLYPIRPVYLPLGLPFSALGLMLDELRKFLIRRNPGGFYEQFTYY